MSGVIAIAIFGKDCSRLFFKIAGPFQRYSHEIEIFVHGSLDLLEDKSNKTTESYLGHLYGSQKFKSFGYVTNSGVQMVVVVEISNLTMKDQELRAFFKKLHSSYCIVLSSPFYTIGTEINARHLHVTADAVLTE